MNAFLVRIKIIKKQISEKVLPHIELLSSTELRV
jgi:hypothetical protein